VEHWLEAFAPPLPFFTSPKKSQETPQKSQVFTFQNIGPLSDTHHFTT
jgi:hypothetical protein